jgi:hypothetical protein
MNENEVTGVEGGGLVSSARVLTELPDRYMRQMCSHFSHKIPASCNETEGRIEFEFGTCDMLVEEGALVLTARASSSESRQRVEAVVAKHLDRFAWRDKPEVLWSVEVSDQG